MHRAPCGFEVPGSVTGGAWGRLLLSLLFVGVFPLGASGQSGLQITVDQELVLVSKDVGESRWAIAAPTNLETVTGNIFPLAGGDPQFVFCRLVARSGVVGASDEQLTYDCELAANCVETSCPASDWQSIPSATLPRSFFEPGAGAPSSVSAAMPPRVQRPAQNVRAGTQITPNARIYLVNKDVGPARWAISFDEGTGRVTGNVFEPGQEPSFVSCDRTGDDQNPDANLRIFRFACEGASSCRAGGCASSGWSDIGEVDLPAGFFLSRVAQTEEEADAVVKVAVDNGRYLDLGQVNDRTMASLSSVALAQPLESIAQLGDELVDGGSISAPCAMGGQITGTCTRDGEDLLTVFTFDGCAFQDATFREQNGILRYRYSECVPVTSRPLGVELAEESEDFTSVEFDLVTREHLATTTRNISRIVRYDSLCPQSTGDERTRDQNGSLRIEVARSGRTLIELKDDVSFIETFNEGCTAFTKTITGGSERYEDSRGSQDVAVTFKGFSTSPFGADSGFEVDSAGDLRLSCNVLSTSVQTRRRLAYRLDTNCPVGGEIEVHVFGAPVATARFTSSGGVVIDHESGLTESFDSCDELSGLLQGCS